VSTATPAIATVVWPLTIFYDASCPLCREEMHALKEYDLDERLRLRDASAPGFDDVRCRSAGIGVADMMRLIHAVDGAGRWYRGIPVFELAYGAAGLSSVARWFASPRLRPVWDRLYPWIARFRQPLSALRLNRAYGAWVRAAARRAHRHAAACKDGVCETPHRPD
jgi:predicted DCC family thiol-disulfide oxidoreductase YuxK